MREYRVTVYKTDVDFKNNFSILSSLPAIISPARDPQISSLPFTSVILRIKSPYKEVNNFEYILKAYADELNVAYKYLFVTDGFFKYYNIVMNSEIVVEIIEMIPLKGVMFGICDSIEVDKINKSDLLCITGKTISESELFSNDLKTTDIKDLLVLECEPTYCGKLTLNTTLTFIKFSNKEYNAISEQFKNTHAKYDSLNCSLIVQNGILSKMLSLNFLTEKTLPYINKMIDSDPQNTIYLSPETVHELELQLYYTLEVELLNSEFTTSNKRYVAISLMEDSKAKDYAFISPQLWFNISKNKKLAKLVGKILEKKYTECFPPAKLVQLSPIIDGSPSYTQNVFDNYFSRDRLLAKRDIIAIPSTEDPLFVEKHDEIKIQSFSKPLLYFKVDNIEAESAADFGQVFRVNKTCSISMGSSKNDYVPAAMSLYYKTPNLIWNSLEPIGLQTYLQELVDTMRPFFTTEEGLEDRAEDELAPHTLVVGPSGAGKTVLIRAVCLKLNLQYQEVNALEFTRDVLSNSETYVTSVLKKITEMAPCLIHFRNLDVAYNELKEAGGTKHIHILMSLIQNINKDKVFPVVAVSSVQDLTGLPSSLFSVFLHTLTIEPLSEEGRREVIDQLLSSTLAAPSVSASYIAQRTAGFLLGHLVDVFTQAMHYSYSRMQEFRKNHPGVTEEMCANSGIQLIHEDFIKSINYFQSHKAYGQGRPSIPEVHWEDIGGLHEVKKEILDTFQLPIQHPELLKSGLHRTGVLLYGPPGTGKTLLAKAVATECSLNFFSVKGPELVNMYVGQSEQNVRDVFSRARAAAPCIIFFDELDSLAPNRGHSGDSGGVMDRVVSQLLVELDGLSKSNEVFVIGATNRPDLLDPSMLRPGRFDRLLYVGIQEDLDSRREILHTLMRKLSTKVDSRQLVEVCPKHLTGADFYSLCSSAMMNALARTIKDIEKGNKSKDAELEVIQEDFDKALAALIPSVSVEEVIRYNQLKDQIEKS